jgi:hypothetical protein
VASPAFDALPLVWNAQIFSALPDESVQQAWEWVVSVLSVDGRLMEY